MNKKIAVFRVVSLCIQLASGCASLEQEPMNAPQAATPPGYVSQAFRDRMSAEPAPEVATLNIGTPSLPAREIWWHAAPADDAPVSEVHSKSISDMLVFGGYGMLKGAATGAVVGLESPLGLLGPIVGVPMGALFGLVGGMASPSMEAVSEWRVVPETNPWYFGDHEKQHRVVVASAPPAPPPPAPIRIQKPRHEQHAQHKSSNARNAKPPSSGQHRSSGNKSSGSSSSRSGKKKK